MRIYEPGFLRGKSEAEHYGRRELQDQLGTSPLQLRILQEDAYNGDLTFRYI